MSSLEVDLRSLFAICAIGLAGCEGSWLYPVPWPDGSELELLQSTTHLHVWAEPKRIRNGTWEPFMEGAESHVTSVLELLDVDEIDKVDVYLHGQCYDPAGPKDCVRLKGQTAGPTLVDLWFSGVFRSNVSLQHSMFRHELAHAVTGQVYGGCPRYLLEEGLAEYARLGGVEPVQPYDVPGTTIDDLAEALASRGGDWIPLDDLVNTADFVRFLEEGTEGLLYAEAGALAEHLIQLEDLPTYIALQDRTCVSNAATFHAVFEELYGAELRDIDRALRNAVDAWQ